LSIRTALEAICKHISGIDCLTPLKPEKLYEFFQFDLKTRNTLDLFEELIPLKTCSLGALMVFANREDTESMLNCVTLGMFVDEEMQRAKEKQHALENWTCFFCFSLEKVEDDTCIKCGQTRVASIKAKKQEDTHLEEKKRKKEEKEKKEKQEGKDEEDNTKKEK
jgi:hypothetical protein